MEVNRTHKGKKRNDFEIAVHTGLKRRRKKKAIRFVSKVTWLKDNQPVEINRNGRFILSNENSLLIAQVEKDDAGNYTCVAANAAGSYSSEPAELVVHGRKPSGRRCE